MNTTDAEIAEKLEGMKRGNLQLDLFEGELWLTIRNKHRGVDIFVDGEVSPSDLLAFCRAVVEKIDGPTFTIEQIDNYVYNNTFCATPYEYSRVWNDALEDTRNRLKDPKDGIAALVKRDKEMA